MDKASELLREGEALLNLFIHALNTPNYGQDENSRCEADERIDKMRAAIAKATS